MHSKYSEADMGISVKLQVFEGPLDLLLHLIDKNKVNIYDIPIAMITEQYMEYVEQLKKEDLNVVSEFLVMAATLLDIKSRMLLPKEVDEEEPGEYRAHDYPAAEDEERVKLPEQVPVERLQTPDEVTQQQCKQGLLCA